MSDKKITYKIGFNTDTSGLNQAKQALNEIKALSSQQFLKINTGNTRADLVEIKSTAQQVEYALNSAFNPKLNTVDFERFSSLLQAASLDIKTIEQRFNKAGEAGKRAFQDLASSILTSNANLEKTETFLDKIGKTLGDAFKWNMAYGTINKIQDGIKNAWKYAVSLDSSLNDIRIVTNKSYQDMEKFAKSANKAAKALGTSTIDYTKGSLIYYQQGLSDTQVKARTDVSAKAANITGQSMQEVSEQLTAVWNGFQVTSQQTELYVDKLAAVAAATASDLEELSTAMSKVASSANTMGIDIDQLTAQISTIESVTRQDAASIGTALKTIYARMGDLVNGEEDEFGVALGDVSGQMKTMGIDILDQAGNLRDLGTVIEEVAGKWDTWTKAQQQAAAIAMAGKRQYNNLFALFENWDMYESSKTTSENSAGTLQKQQDIYMESTQAHLEQLQTAAEKFKNALFDNEGFNKLIDVLTWVMNQIGDITDAVGGISTLLTGTIGVLAPLFKDKIGKGVVDFFNSLNLRKDNAQQIDFEKRIKNQFGENVSDEAVQKAAQYAKEMTRYGDLLTEDEKERYEWLIKITIELDKQKQSIEELKKASKEVLAHNEGVGSGYLGQKDLTLRTKDGKTYKNGIDEQKQELKTQRTNFLEEIKDNNIGEKGITIFNKRATQLLDSGKLSKEQEEKIHKQFDSLDITDQKTIDGALSVIDEIYQELQNSLKVIKDIKDFSAEKYNDLTKESQEDLTKNLDEEKARAIGRNYRALSGDTSPEQLLRDADEQIRVEGDGRKSKELKTAKDEFESANNKLKTVKDAKNKKNTARKELNDAKNQKKSLQDIEKAQKKLTKATKDYNEVEKENGTLRDNQGKVDKARKKLTDEMIEATEQEIDQIDSASKGFQDLSQAQENAAASGEKVNEEADKLSKSGKWKESISNITLCIGAISQLISIWFSLYNVINMWFDSSATGWKAVEKSIIGIGIPAITLFVGALKFAQAKHQEGTAAFVLAEKIKQLEVKKTSKISIAEVWKATWEVVKAAVTSIIAWLPLIAIVAGIIIALGAIALCVVAVSNASSDLDKANEKWEKQQEILSGLQDNLENVQSAYEDLLDTIEGYESALDAVEELKAGTDEWADAIVNANKQALELISNNSELAKYATTDENGLITISDEGLEMAKKAQKAIVQKAQAAVYAQQAKVNDAASEVTKQSWREKAGYENDSNDIYDTALKNYQEQGADYLYSDDFMELTKGLSSNAEKLQSLRESLQESILATEANTKANELLNVQYTKNMLANDATYNKADDQDMYAKIMTGLADDVTDKYSANTADKKFLDEQDEKEAFAGAFGIDQSNIIGINEGVIKYRDAKGAMQEISKESAAAAMNQYNALKEAGKDASEVLKLVNQISSSSALSAFSGLTNGAKYTALEDATLGSLDNMKNAALEEAKSLTDEQLELLGYTLKEYEQAIKESVEKTKKEIEDNVKTIEAFGGSGVKTSDLTAQQAKQVRAGVENASRYAGQQGVDALASLNDLSADERAIAAQAAANIDWTSVTATADFVAEMEKLGQKISVTDPRYATLINRINASQDALKACADNFDSVREQLEKIEDLTDGLSLGDIVDQEDYAAMIAMNAALKDYFVLTSKGYMLIKGSGKEVNSILKAQYSSLDGIKEHYAELNSLGTSLDEKDVSLNINAESKDLVSNIKDLGLTEDEKQLVLKQASVDVDSYNKIMSDYDNNNKFTDSQKTAIKAMASTINTIRTTAAAGGYDESQAVQDYYTSLVDSLNEVEEAFAKGKIKSEDYAKIRLYWLQEYADTYGLSTEAIEGLIKAEEDARKAGDELTVAQKQEAINAALATASFLQQKDALVEMEELLSNAAVGQEKLNSLQRIADYEQTGVEDYKKLLDTSVFGYKDYRSAMEAYESLAAKGFNNDDDLKEKWDNYIELWQKYEEAQDSAAEARIAIIDEEIQTTQDLTDLEKKRYEFSKKYFKDGRLKSIAELQEEDSIKDRYEQLEFNRQLNKETLAAIEEQITVLQKKNNLSDQEKTKLQDLRDEYAETAQTAMDEWAELWDVWTDGWDEIFEKYEDYMDLIEKSNDLLEDQINLYEKVRKFISLSGVELTLTSELYDQQIKNYQKLSETALSEYQAALEQYNNAQTESERQDAAKRLAETAQTAMGYVESTFDTILAKFEAELDEVFNTYGLGDESSENWERAKAKEDQYLSAAKAQLEYNKLARSFQKSIEESGSVAAQQKLAKVMQEQLKILKEKDKLSQYEVDRANAVYELTLKQIALEESQRNASKMQLVRDANGNLTYSYVQDQDAAADAQAELEEARYNLYELDQNQATESVDEGYSLAQEIKQAFIDAANDPEKMEMLREYYFGEAGLWTEYQRGLNITLSNIQKYEEDFSSALIKEISDLSSLDTEGLKEKITELIGSDGEGEDEGSGLLGDLSKLKTPIVELANSLGALTGNNGILSQTAGSLEELEEAVGSLIDELLGTEIKDENGNVTRSGGIKAAISSTTDSLKSVTSSATGLSGAMSTAADYNNANTVQSYIDKNGIVTERQLKESSEDMYLMYNNLGSSKKSIKFRTPVIVEIQKKPKPGGGGGGGYSYVSSLDSVPQFDTGGYTGEWGNSGKLAMLHEKELVLNADDTVNLLTAVEIMRALGTTLDKTGLDLTKAVGSFNATRINNVDSNDTIVEQVVHIDADFPNVTDREEIQEAFNNLINLAAQRANEKLK